MSPVELSDLYLDRIDRHDARLNAFCHRADDEVDVAGWPTTYGSAGASPAPAKSSDQAVRRFVDAGFVLLGKTTTSR